MGDCYAQVQSYSQTQRPECYKNFPFEYDIIPTVPRINDMVFRGEPFAACVAKLDELKGPLEASTLSMPSSIHAPPL